MFMQTLLARSRAVWKPEMYHGQGMSRDFFEGWYFKMVDPEGEHAIAIIPGVFLAPGVRSRSSRSLPATDGSHAFVQTLDGRNGESFYHRYPIGEFESSGSEFEIRIGPNIFRSDRISLAIDRPEQLLSGELRFAGRNPWPVRLLSPGIMGWYALVPFMECYHGVISLDHSIEGSLRTEKEAIDFSGGRGYIEKDWGAAFPKGWIWMQCNHFGNAGTSLTLSVGHIPWLRGSFRGFIAGFLHRGELHRFATYTGARLEKIEIGETSLMLTLRDARHELSVEARRSGGGMLHAPSREAMIRRVLESLTAEIQVRLIDCASGRELFAGGGRHGGLEVGGETALLLNPPG